MFPWCFQPLPKKQNLRDSSTRLFFFGSSSELLFLVSLDTTSTDFGVFFAFRALFTFTCTRAVSLTALILEQRSLRQCWLWISVLSNFTDRFLDNFFSRFLLVFLQKRLRIGSPFGGTDAEPEVSPMGPQIQIRHCWARFLIFYCNFSKDLMKRIQ